MACQWDSDLTNNKCYHNDLMHGPNMHNIGERDKNIMVQICEQLLKHISIRTMPCRQIENCDYSWAWHSDLIYIQWLCTDSDTMTWVEVTIEH